MNDLTKEELKVVLDCLNFANSDGFVGRGCDEDVFNSAFQKLATSHE